MANRITAPEDLSSGSWSKLNSTVDSNAVTAPDGTLTADRLNDSGLGGSGVVRLQQAVSGLVDGSNYYLAWFIKPDQTDWAYMDDGGFTANFGMFTDIASGLAGTLDADVNSSGVQDFGNGWYRAHVTWTSGADGAGVIRPSLANADNNGTVPLDGTNSIFGWGIVLDDYAGGDIPDYVSVGGFTVSPPVAGGYTFSRTSTKALSRILTKSLTRDIASQ